jgi:hypothetical protein
MAVKASRFGASLVSTRSAPLVFCLGAAALSVGFDSAALNGSGLNSTSFQMILKHRRREEQLLIPHYEII